MEPRGFPSPPRSHPSSLGLRVSSPEAWAHQHTHASSLGAGGGGDLGSDRAFLLGVALETLGGGDWSLLLELHLTLEEGLSRPGGWGWGWGYPMEGKLHSPIVRVSDTHLLLLASCILADPDSLGSGEGWWRDRPVPASGQGVESRNRKASQSCPVGY